MRSLSGAGIGAGAGAGNGKRFTFPRRGFLSNVTTLIGEEPIFVSSFVTTQLNKAGVALILEKLRS